MCIRHVIYKFTSIGNFSRIIIMVQCTYLVKMKSIYDQFHCSINLLRIYIYVLVDTQFIRCRTMCIGIELNEKRCNYILVASDIYKHFFKSHKCTIVFVFKMDAHIYGEKNSRTLHYT